MSKNLQRLQMEFQAYIQERSIDIFPDIATPSSISRQSRLTIYQEAYFTRLIDALICDFPATQRLIGETLFSQLAKQYIKQYPSQQASLHGLGRHFPLFLEQHHSLWSELARFELALVNAFEAIDAPMMTMTKLQQIPADQWDQLRFHFHPSVQLLFLQWNTVFLWKNLHKIKPPRVKQCHQKQTWLVWRQHHESYFVKLNRHEAWALQAAIQNRPFAEICQGLQQWTPQKQLILFATQLLTTWVQRQLLIDDHVAFCASS